MKEGLKVNPASVTQASVTFQCFFRYYERLAGMTVRFREQHFALSTTKPPWFGACSLNFVPASSSCSTLNGMAAVYTATLVYRISVSA